MAPITQLELQKLSWRPRRPQAPPPVIEIFSPEGGEVRESFWGSRREALLEAYTVTLQTLSQATEGRHGSFCMRAANWQPYMCRIVRCRPQCGGFSSKPCPVGRSKIVTPLRRAISSIARFCSRNFDFP